MSVEDRRVFRHSVRQSPKIGSLPRTNEHRHFMRMCRNVHISKDFVVSWAPRRTCRPGSVCQGARPPLYRVTLVVADLVWVDLYFDVPIPMSARFCWGQWGYGRTGWAAGQYDGTSELKSTQPRSATTSVTLYCISPSVLRQILA